MSRSEGLTFVVFVSIALAVISAFAFFWFRIDHLPTNFGGSSNLLDLIFYLLVSYIVWHPIVMAIFTWAVTSNIKQLATIKPEPGLKVAFITNFVPASESIALLEKALPAMVKASYKHDTWLLDEGGSDEARALCDKLGVKYFTRSDKPHYNTEHGKYARKTKGGNHNSWYDAHGNEYDFVAQIDTDFVAKKDFLTKTLGYFKNPKVAFVGTPQIYGNTQSSLIAKGAAQQTYNFYGPLLRGFQGMGMNMLIGANHVIRVSALKDVDHYSAHITEDLLTGMKLHAKGWESVYVPEALAIGEGPSTWQAFFNQQMRWAYGCMHILFNHSLRLFRTMSWRQRIYYFFLQQHYFTGIAMGLSTVGIALYFFTGLQTTAMELVPFLSLYLPVLGVVSFISLWIQRFNVRPKEERGPLLAGLVVSVATWPVFFMAFISLFKRKRLTYKVTPKGKDAKPNENSLTLFRVHFILGTISLGGLLYGFTQGRTSPVMLFWAFNAGLLLHFVPMSQTITNRVTEWYVQMVSLATRINSYLKIFEFSTHDQGLLPESPTDSEKYSYIKRNHRYLLFFSFISFASISFSMFRFILNNPTLWVLLSFLILTIIYYVISLFVNVGTKDFNIDWHRRLVDRWRPSKHPTVDIFLPTAGEPLDVLRNTWEGVQQIRDTYTGKLEVYCLDDGDHEKVKTLAQEFDFNYVVRPNRGEFKKAGNLRHGFSISSGDFIVIFDADFRPRADFLDELMPYFDHDNKIGIVQSPQYFDVHTQQNWLERGAGAVQELFYRFSQVSRQNHEASICVGSNAIYRRMALNDTGGTALIEHSEDVHTGFNLRMHGWKVRYIPVVVAKGLCPSSMQAFFKQQYRWCMGSMSLLSSDKFWKTKLSFRARLSYVSGFLYYIHTALSSFYVPIIPLFLLLFYPDKIKIEYTIFILPAFIFSQIIYPIWHRSIYGIEAWSVRSIYGWAHLFAIRDAISKSNMPWQATGAVKGRNWRYTSFRAMQFFFNFIPALIWVGYASYFVITKDMLTYLPILFSGSIYLAVTSKVTFYSPNRIGFDYRSHRLTKFIRRTS